MESTYLVGRVAVHQRKKLPHWDAEYGIQFVTMHLASGRLFDRVHAAAVADVLEHDDERLYELLAWCVMPDHLHVVTRPRTELARIVRTWKSVTAHRFGGTWWQPDYFDHLVRDTRELEETVDYVMNNPEAASLVDWDFRRMYPERLSRCL